MTLVMAWRSEDGLTVCADTRIADGDARVTDVGPKLFQVPVEVTPFGLNDEPVQHLTVGFAFSGNTLMAQSCCAIASTCLASLSAVSAEALVAPESIVHFFAKAAEYVSEERRFLTPASPPRFEAMIFGWDQVQLAPFIYHVEVADVDNKLVATVERKPLSVGGIAYFGSGAKFLGETLKKLDQKPPHKTISPHQLMEAAIASAQVKSVGGSLQFATASKSGVRLRSFMRVSRTGEADISILGCSIRKLWNPEGPIPGAGGIAVAIKDDIDYPS